LLSPHQRNFAATIPTDRLDALGDEARRKVLTSADAILRGRWEILGVSRSDIATPDWFYDPKTGRRAPSDLPSFSINYRDEDLTGNVKQVWELSRLHHLTVLAAAYALSGDESYANAVDRQLRSWWEQNPFLLGINWTSGIEIAVRLIALVWVRRLLDSWPKARDLFEHNDRAAEQIYWHQRYLAAFPSRGSSANNHLVAETAGAFVGAAAFPWFRQSSDWAAAARAALARALETNTFPSGVNRELASEYHCFVAELGLLAAVEGDLAGLPLPEASWHLLGRMLDVLAATVDAAGRPPRQGDGDDGHALVVEAAPDRAASLLETGRRLLDAPTWWPRSTPDAASAFVTSLAASRHTRTAPLVRPAHFADAGLTILRSSEAELPEIWVRCDAGPHGYLSIAAHAHADALAVEVRHGGVDILADPGTYCYHGEPELRQYFRSTLAHNTLQLADRCQSSSGGPFLWTRHARTQLQGVDTTSAATQIWSARHDGYTDLDPRAEHTRTVRLLAAERRIEVEDRLDTSGRYQLRLLYHLGPSVTVSLQDRTATLRWPAPSGGEATALLELPTGLHWQAVRASTQPTLGWYSPSFGRLEASTTLVGEAMTPLDASLLTELRFLSDVGVGVHGV